HLSDCTDCQTRRSAAMTAHLRLIRQKLDHLTRIRAYLAYSPAQSPPFMPIKVWAELTPEQYETFAAFRAAGFGREG
ncbi:MAG: hypothetical protein WAT23_16210, partial [Chromatiaceae bacterium]